MPKDKMDFSRLTTEERLNMVERIYIAYPRSEGILAKIKHCHSYSSMSAEPECMLIIGDTGAGKTTLYRRYEQQHPRVETKERSIIPVLSSTIPVPATPKSLATKLLVKMGDPLAQSGTLLSQTLRLYVLLKRCEVRLIILDEFQHFIDRDSNKVLQTISDWLKELLNETRIPVVLIGMPKCEQILAANRQLKRRFAIHETLEPFRWKHDDPQIEKTLRDDFRKFLSMLDKQLPLKERSHLADIEIAYRIYCATQGRVASIVNLIRRAVLITLSDGEELISMERLSRAYKERLEYDQPSVKNPFLP
ncbi:MAG: hypothetical protein QOJ70_536 [Acidobacteriota bacterium]|jgi:Cdc6-like AAA superfamily ATPase|nr:hypothetical protein [Acidobacteriota bacterium]